ncbi:MAG: baseplate J/gp47 family protein [Synergistaceae bacterium]
MLRLKSHREILAGLITKAYERGLLSDDIGFFDRITRGESIENNYVLFLASFADILAEYYQDLQSLLNSFDVDRATGSDLDRLASLVGLERLGPTRSIAPITFEKLESAHDEEILVPANTRIATESGIIYSTMYEAVIAADELQATTYAISAGAGPETRIGAGELTVLVDQVEGVTVFNHEASTGGNSAEDDNSLARRIRMWPFEQQRGTYTAYESALNRVAGLRSFKIIPRWDGPGTVKVIVDPPSNVVVDFARDAIVDVQAADEDVKVVGVEEKVVNVHCVATFETTGALLGGKRTENLEYYLEKDIRAYIDGGRASNGQIVDGLGIGENFSPFKLMNYLADLYPELEDVDFEYPAKKVVISDNERATSGIIEITFD